MKKTVCQCGYLRLEHATDMEPIQVSTLRFETHKISSKKRSSNSTIDTDEIALYRTVLGVSHAAIDFFNIVLTNG